MHETAAVGPQEEEDEWRPFHRVLEDGEVLPKGQVVNCSCVASRECGGTRADKRPDHGGISTPTREKINHAGHG